MAVDVFVRCGLHLFDEPDAALSPARRLSFLSRSHEMVGQGSQFLIATHSPILRRFGVRDRGGSVRPRSMDGRLRGRGGPGRYAGNSESRSFSGIAPINPRPAPSPRQAASFASIPCAISVSAICTAFSAAPLRRLSDTHQNDSPCGTVGSLRMRLTNTASSPWHSSWVT